MDHEGPTTKKKCGKFGSYPFKVDINLFFSSSGQRNLLQTMRCPPASVEEYQDFAKHVSWVNSFHRSKGENILWSMPPTIGVSYQKLLSRFRDSKTCSTTLDLISSDIPSQKKICDSSRPPQLKCCQLRWHLADVDTARTLGGQWSLGAPQIVVEVPPQPLDHMYFLADWRKIARFSHRTISGNGGVPHNYHIACNFTFF